MENGDPIGNVTHAQPQVEEVGVCQGWIIYYLKVFTGQFSSHLFTNEHFYIVYTSITYLIYDVYVLVSNITYIHDI